jgi:hypothetical protein
MEKQKTSESTTNQNTKALNNTRNGISIKTQINIGLIISAYFIIRCGVSAVFGV